MKWGIPKVALIAPKGAMKMKSTDVLNPRLANHTLKLRVAQN